MKQLFDWVKSCRNKCVVDFILKKWHRLCSFFHFFQWIKRNRKRVFMPEILLDSWSFEILAINTICYMKNILLTMYPFITGKKYMKWYNLTLMCFVCTMNIEMFFEDLKYFFYVFFLIKTVLALTYFLLCMYVKYKTFHAL